MKIKEERGGGFPASKTKRWTSVPNSGLYFRVVFMPHCYPACSLLSPLPTTPAARRDLLPAEYRYGAGPQEDFNPRHGRHSLQVWIVGKIM